MCRILFQVVLPVLLITKLTHECMRKSALATTAPLAMA
jgi:hypothetical protein